MQLKEVVANRDYITEKELIVNLRHPWENGKVRMSAYKIPQWYIVTPTNIRWDVCRAVEFWLRIEWENKMSSFSYPIGLFAHYFIPFKE